MGDFWRLGKIGRSQNASLAAAVVTDDESLAENSAKDQAAEETVNETERRQGDIL
jgi:hypothetical protein